jgi:hypothetical protein
MKGTQWECEAFWNEVSKSSHRDTADILDVIWHFIFLRSRNKGKAQKQEKKDLREQLQHLTEFLQQLLLEQAHFPNWSPFLWPKHPKTWAWTIGANNGAENSPGIWVRLQVLTDTMSCNKPCLSVPRRLWRKHVANSNLLNEERVAVRGSVGAVHKSKTR